jgi:hypothetical protein
VSEAPHHADLLAAARELIEAERAWNEMWRTIGVSKFTDEHRAIADRQSQAWSRLRELAASDESG